MTCYNHKDTILRALDSVLDQETDFYFKVIVVDDGSTDGTAELLRNRYPVGNLYTTVRDSSYNGKYRSKMVEVHLLPHQGIMKTYAYAFRLCKNDYIAVCDGDDYWIDHKKLQLQYDYMQSNPDVGFCTTRVYQERGNVWADVGEPADVIEHSLTFEHLLRGNSYINAQTYFIRREVFFHWVDFDKFIRLGFYVWDYPIVLELINRTKFHHIDIITAVFTIHDSYTHTTSRKKRLKMVVGQWWIRTYYIFRFGCKPSTFIYSWYRLARDIYSVIFKRWYK